MTVSLTVHCDQGVDAWSACGRRFHAGTPATGTADEKAAAAGWAVMGDGRHLCPVHSGRPRLLPSIPEPTNARTEAGVADLDEHRARRGRWD